MLVHAAQPGSPLAISERDRSIVEAARAKLRGARADFADAARALREAVEELIPGGRVFVLGATARGPIIGSLVSGVGIAAGGRGVTLVRARHGEPLAILGSFAR